jgi:hypothetical protein
LTLPDTAQYYGLKPNRSGFINCIFHNDKTPSMKLYPAHFHCYGCGEHGDIIKLTGQLFSLSPYQAAQKIAQDFNIITQGNGYKNIKPVKPRISEQMKYIQEENRTYEILNFYVCFLEKCREDFKPEHPEDEPHSLFVESLHKCDQYNYYRDIFITGTDGERREFLNVCRDVITALEKRFTPQIKIEKEYTHERKKASGYDR